MVIAYSRVILVTGTPTAIHHLSLSEGLEVVGVTQTLMGDTIPILQALQQKADAWLTALQSNFLLRHLLWTMVHHVLWPLLCYPLSITSLSPSQAPQTVTKLYQVLLPRLGINHHFPMVLRCALPQFHSLRLLNPYWEQGLVASASFWSKPTPFPWKGFSSMHR